LKIFNAASLGLKSLEEKNLEALRASAFFYFFL